MAHLPVMLDEVLAALALRDQGLYVDCTFGRGGHAAAILARLGDEGRLWALDRDPEAAAAGAELMQRDARFRFIKAPFSQLREVIRERDALGSVDGLLLDLGVSSPQLDDAQRGFSFANDGPLDMRMDPAAGESAADWLNRAPQDEIRQVLREYGDERHAGRIARAIVQARTDVPFSRTAELSDLIRRVAGAKAAKSRIHPATRSFQAIRIRVNSELNELTSALDAAVDILRPGGRLVVISFHSIEDRIVKRFIRHAQTGRFDAFERPESDDWTARLVSVGGLQKPSADEETSNPRARSAKLRVAERTAA